jgi:hypothetical protein
MQQTLRNLEGGVRAIDGEECVMATVGNQALIEGPYRPAPGKPGNFEALILDGSNLAHYWRDNNASGTPWHRSVVVSSAATGPACMIEGPYRPAPGKPGNFEALVLEGHNLVHYWRDNNASGAPWRRSVVVSSAATGPACMIEGPYRPAPGKPGNFEALVLEGHNLVHYWRDNNASGTPWRRSVVVSSAATGPACMIEGPYRPAPGKPGNFEALVQEGAHVSHYWRNNTASSTPWARSVTVI